MVDSRTTLEIASGVTIEKGERFIVNEIDEILLPIPQPVREPDVPGDVLVVLGFDTVLTGDVIRVKYEGETGHWEYLGHETPPSNLAQALERGLIEREVD